MTTYIEVTEKRIVHLGKEMEGENFEQALKGDGQGLGRGW